MAILRSNPRQEIFQVVAWYSRLNDDPSIVGTYLHRLIQGEMRRFHDRGRNTHGGAVTMIYAHCVPVMTVKELKSPLDF